MIVWYQIRVNCVQLSPELTFTYFYQLQKDELYVSPHIRLSGHTKEANIGDKKLAQQFLDKCLPIFKKRYGDDTILTIDEWSTYADNKYLLKRIKKDTAIIKARIDQNNMASNKKVIL